MSNAFSNFLSGAVGGLINAPGNLRDYQHANRLYVQNNYSRAPKFGFMYFVQFNIEDGIPLNDQWKTQGGARDVGFLVKKIDMPKFTMVNEVVNQYNKKTVIQTGIKYNPISMEFHDDNKDITNSLWTNYYRYYFTDGRYGDSDTSGANYINNRRGGTKYSDKDYPFGLNSGQNNPFFKSIDIYVLHQHNFTQMTLVNPLVTEWSHDNLDQTESSKILSNRMSVAYEAVFYKQGRIAKGQGDQFTAHYYDKTPSPLSVGGQGSSSLFGGGGVIAGVDGVFGSLADGNYLGAALQAVTTVRNAKNLTVQGVLGEASGIATSALAGIATSNVGLGPLTGSGAFNLNGLTNAATGGVRQSGSLGVVLSNNQFSNTFQTAATQASITGR